MGLKIGIIVFARETKPPFARLMKQLASGAAHLGRCPPEKQAFFLDEMTAAVGTHRGFTFVFSRLVASVLAGTPSRYGRPKDRPWIEKEARKCDILVASMHSISSQYGHVLFLGGRLIGAESNMDGSYDCVSYRSRFPDWYAGPSEQFSYNYAMDLASAFAGLDVAGWLDNAPELELYQL